MIRTIEGDLIKLALAGKFDVITHGCNCFCTMNSGIAVSMKQKFDCDAFPMEDPKYRGDINKLGTIDYMEKHVYPVTRKIKHGDLFIDSPDFGGITLTVINSYTQFRYGRNHLNGDLIPADYDAIALCMKKINHIFKGKIIGLPMIGAGLGGGDWSRIERIIEKELKDMDVIIVKL